MYRGGCTGLGKSPKQTIFTLSLIMGGETCSKDVKDCLSYLFLETLCTVSQISKCVTFRCVLCDNQRSKKMIGWDDFSFVTVQFLFGVFG